MGAAGAAGPIARGRDADVYALGDGRVLRRYRRPGPTDRERRVMAHARAHGYPVPQVYEWTGTDMVMDRLDGPSMLADLAR
ncbi:MAG TPA: serine/threonine protein kinase, partial [Actinomycetes bacterium]|nr:serine/threonine protein kinase [Actinomycetes bacterium]